MLNLIRSLSSIGPHPGGSNEEIKIAEFFADSIKNYCDDLYFDKFSYIDMKKLGKESLNVIGSFKGKTDKKIVICTNIDTIRDYNVVVDLWEQRNKDSSNVPHVEGANEPNSAIAFLIYFAKRLSEEKLSKNVDLIGFGAQEDWYATLKDTFDGWSKRRLRKKMKRLGYLIGSRHFVLSKGVKNIDSVIAIDAVAIGAPKIVSGDSFVKSTLSTDFFKDLESIKIGGFRIKPGKRSAVGIGCDHLPFLVAGVPSTWIIASKGMPSEKNIFGYILNHNNIPNYCTAGDTYNNLVEETSNEEIIRNFKLLSDSLIGYIRKRKL